MSHFVELLVWAPVAVINEGSEYHIEADSNLKLHCSLRQQSPVDGNNATLPLSVQLSSAKHPTLETVSRDEGKRRRFASQTSIFLVVMAISSSSCYSDRFVIED